MKRLAFCAVLLLATASLTACGDSGGKGGPDAKGDTSVADAADSAADVADDSQVGPDADANLPDEQVPPDSADILADEAADQADSGDIQTQDELDLADMDDLADGLDLADASDLAEVDVFVPECDADNPCGVPDSPCLANPCVEGVCVPSFVAAGSPAGDSIPGDCHVDVCDGLGGMDSILDASDLPPDVSACEVGICGPNGASTEFLPAFTTCGADVFCDGQGKCLGCLSETDCPGDLTECGSPTCVEGLCGMAFAAFGTPLSSQSAGDCLKAVCDGEGGTTSVDANDDTNDDSRQCTDDVCLQGVPTHVPKPLGTECFHKGGTLCNLTGDCVECLADTDCLETGTYCQNPICVDGVCDVENLAEGEVMPTQQAGDCLVWVCSGDGTEIQDFDDSDVYVDGIECTQDACQNGVPTNPARPAGASCNQNDGTVCNGAGNCVECLSYLDCPDHGGCSSEVCQTPTCTDLLPNGDEGDMDCGGLYCIRCDEGDTCFVGTDCAYGGCLDGACFTCGSDASEPNGIETLAKQLDGTTAVTLSLCPLDRDWFRMTPAESGVGLAILVEPPVGSVATYSLLVTNCLGTEIGMVEPFQMAGKWYWGVRELPDMADVCFRLEASGLSPETAEETATMTAVWRTECLLDSQCPATASFCPYAGPLAGLCAPAATTLPDGCGLSQDYSKSAVAVTGATDFTGALCDLGAGYPADWDWWMFAEPFAEARVVKITYDDGALQGRSFVVLLVESLTHAVTRFEGVDGVLVIDGTNLTSGVYYILVTLEGGDGTLMTMVSYTIRRPLCNNYVTVNPGGLNIPVGIGTTDSVINYQAVYPLVRTSTSTTIANDGCLPIAAGSLTGTVALIRRGTCTFAAKASNAIQAGAVGVLIYNNAVSPTPLMPGGVTTVTVPLAGMTAADGLTINGILDLGDASVQWREGCLLTP